MVSGVDEGKDAALRPPVAMSPGARPVWKLTPYRRARRAVNRVMDVVRRARGEMATPWQRFLAHFENIVVDHSFIRHVYLNRHAVSARLERSGQPAPHQFRAAARRGIRTVINLRGPRDCGSYILERRECREQGLTLVDCSLFSRSAPPRAQLLKLLDIYDSIAYPALIHCKSGADRAGIAAAVFVLHAEGRSAAEALRQLSLRYGHFRRAKTGVLDAVIAAYGHAQAATGITFRAWVETAYDPEAIEVGFRSNRFANLITDRLLRRE